MKQIGWIILSLFTTMTACRKKDAALPDNVVSFETASVGITSLESGATVKLKLSRATDRDITILLKLTNTAIVYNTDYTTLPAANASGEVTLTIPSGNNETSFSVSKLTGILFDGDEKLTADIYSSSAPVIIGLSRQLVISFGELVATNNTSVINGGGATFQNKTFIDLSANRQTAINRTNWDLGFYGGADDFRAVLNSSVNMMVKQTNKTDMNAVTVADTIGLTNEVGFSQTTPATTQMAYIDHPNGDLTKTAIAAIAATASENKVYLVNRGTGIGNPGTARGWKKIRILRNATGGYTLQHADLNAATFTSVDISKDDNYSFQHVSFEQGKVSVDPPKKKWDIAWTYFANVTNFGSGEVPYMFQDIIILNRDVQVAKVLTSSKSFNDFAEADIAAQTFMSTQNAIAADWRSGGGPGVSPAVRTDRFYIVKDSDHNFYKLRFTALTNNGERGYPAYEAILIKRGG